MLHMLLAVHRMTGSGNGWQWAAAVQPAPQPMQTQTDRAVSTFNRPKPPKISNFLVHSTGLLVWSAAGQCTDSCLGPAASHLLVWTAHMVANPEAASRLTQRACLNAPLVILGGAFNF